MKCIKSIEIEKRKQLDLRMYWVLMYFCKFLNCGNVRFRQSLAVFAVVPRGRFAIFVPPARGVSLVRFLVQTTD